MRNETLLSLFFFSSSVCVCTRRAYWIEVREESKKEKEAEEEEGVGRRKERKPLLSFFCNSDWVKECYDGAAFSTKPRGFLLLWQTNKKRVETLHGQRWSELGSRPSRRLLVVHTVVERNLITKKREREIGGKRGEEEDLLETEQFSFLSN